MACVRKVECSINKSTDFCPAEIYMVTLTRDDLATLCKAAICWNFDKGKTLEVIINGSLVLFREILSYPDGPQPQEL